MKVYFKYKLNSLHLVKLSFFSMLLYSSFLMEAMDVQISNLTFLLGVLTALLMVFDMMYSSCGLSRIMTKEVKLLLFFTLICVCGLPLAQYTRSAMNGLTQLLQCILLMMITIYICMRDGSVTFCAKVVVLVMAAAAIYGLINASSFDSRLALTEESNSNVFGHNAVLGIGLSILGFGSSKKIWRFLIPALWLVFAAGVVLSASRMSLIALMGYLLFYLIYYIPRNNQRSAFATKAIKLLFALGMAAGILVCLAPYFENTLIAERMSALFRVVDSGDGDGQARIYLYQTAWRHFLDNPVFGIGYANFAPWHSGVYSHSTYAEVLSCTGIMGTIPFLAFYWSMWKELRHGVKLHDPALRKTNMLLLMMFIALLLLGIGEILIYKVKYFIVYGILSAQFYLNRRCAELDFVKQAPGEVKL